MTDIQQAIYLIKQGRKREAQLILEAQIRSDPHDIKSWFWYVETLDSIEKRIQLLEVCLKQNPNNPQALQALEMLRDKQSPLESSPIYSSRVEPYTSHERVFEHAARQSDLSHGEEVAAPQALYENHGGKDPIHKQESSLPTIDIPENQNVIAYIKTSNSFFEPIVPYSYDKVNHNRTHSDFTDFIISSASGLPQNCKYVVYGCAALVHPDSGIIFGFAIGMSAYYRLPTRTAKEVEAHFDKIFSRVQKKKNAKRTDENPSDGNFLLLGSNWSKYTLHLSPSLLRKCYDYYGKRLDDDGVIQLNVEEDLRKIELPTFFDNLIDRVTLPLYAVVFFAIVIFVFYAMDKFKINDVVEFLKSLN